MSNPSAMNSPAAERVLALACEVSADLDAVMLNPTPARTFIGIGFAATIEAAGSAVGIPPF